MASRMENSDIIISGPELSVPEFWGSVAEFMVPKLKSHPKDLVLQVDCATKESITSEEFLRQSLGVAEGLVENGLEEGDVVALMGPNCIRNHVTALGILFSGGILATFEEEVKSFELQHLLKQSRPKFVFCPEWKREEIRTNSEAVNLDPRIILLDSKEPVSGLFKWEDIRAEVDVGNYVPRKVANSKETVVLICFSSGTTGWPKGVAITHYSVVHNLVMLETLSVPAKHENFIFATPLYWISGFMLLTMGCYLGRTRFIPRSTDPADFLEAVQICKPFFFLAAPNVVLSLVRYPNFKKYDVSSLKVIFSAGGTLGKEVLAEIKTLWPEITVCNLYGSTETFGGITQAAESESSNAVGKLIPNISVKIVDPSTGKSLGPHKVGEFRVKGGRLMKGYWNNEKDTKAAFDEKGWLRMGDLGYYDEDHVFYFAGRIKEVIQYLNHQISPTELESFLTCVPGVKDAAIVPIPHEEDDNHIRALIVKQANSQISAEEIIQAVKENFAHHKHLTAGVQFVDSLPRTAIGKLRRVELQKLVDMSKS